MADPREDAKRIAWILRDGDYDYDGSKYLFKLARRRAGLKPPENRKNTVDRMTQEETERFIGAAYKADVLFGEPLAVVGNVPDDKLEALQLEVVE